MLLHLLKKKFIFIFSLIFMQDLTAYSLILNQLNNLAFNIKKTVLGIDNEDSEKMIHCKFENLSGTIPYKLFLIINEFKSSIDNDFFINRLILHGPPGNGKTTYANLIAKATDSLFFEMKGSIIVDRYQGSGANNIEDEFAMVLKKHAESNKKVVLFIDEVDAIANSKNMSGSNAHVDHETAVQTLWLNLDLVRHNKNIFVIVATNRFKDLHPTLVDRFGDNIIEIKNPNLEMRKEIILFYLNKFAIRLDQKIVDKLILDTEGFSVRSIEYLLCSIKRRCCLNNGIINFDLIQDMLKTYKKKPQNSSTDIVQRDTSFIALQRKNIYLSMFIMISSICCKACNYLYRITQ